MYCSALKLLVWMDGTKRCILPCDQGCSYHWARNGMLDSLLNSLHEEDIIPERSALDFTPMIDAMHG